MSVFRLLTPLVFRGKLSSVGTLPAMLFLKMQIAGQPPSHILEIHAIVIRLWLRGRYSHRYRCCDTCRINDCAVTRPSDTLIIVSLTP